METAILTKLGAEEVVQRAAKALSEGGIILYPTDTVYGLGVDATNPEALKALQALKGREEGKPMLVMLGSIQEAETYAKVTDTAQVLADAFLPGALTLVLPAKGNLSAEVSRDGTVGIRIPDDPFCRALSHAFPKPITSTSANRAGLLTRASISDICDQLGAAAEDIALAIDAGERSGGTPSTIVAINGSEYHLLREGPISEGKIKEVLEATQPA